MLVHLDHMRSAGIVRISSPAFHDTSRIWPDRVYPHRVRFDPILVLPKPKDIHDFYKANLGSKSAKGYFRSTMRSMPKEEFDLFRAFLEKAVEESLNVIQTAPDLSSFSPGETYLLLRSESDSRWPDIEGKEYHYGTNVTNQSQLMAGASVVIRRSVAGQNVFIGQGRVTSVKEIGTEQTQKGKPIAMKVAYLDNYIKYEPPKKWTTGIEELLKSLPTYNHQNSIVTVTKQVFDRITSSNETELQTRILTSQQFARLERLYSEFFASGTDADWLQRIEEIEKARKSYLELLQARDFEETGIMSIEDAKRIGQYLKIFSKNTALDISLNTRLASSDDELRLFCERLRLLLFSDDELPYRIQRFDEVPLVGAQTITQFLSFHYPDRYPFVSKEQIEAIVPPVTEDQINRAFESFNFSEEVVRKTPQETRDTLGRMRILEEVKERLGIPDYISLNIFLIRVYQKIPGPPTPEIMTLERLEKETSMEASFFLDLERELLQRKQVILFGPPGTSKTFVATQFAEYFAGGKQRVNFVQFHPSYSYEDFVEGIRPELTEESKQVTYVVRDGFIKRIARIAEDDPEKFVIIIDEINRGNIPRIFGEMIYLLERRDADISLAYTPEKKFRLPPNLYIIGTMNSADRSIALVDYALRRRFDFFEMIPDEQILSKWLQLHSSSIEVEKVVRFFREINSRIGDDQKLGKDFRIGHSYFMIDELDKSKLRDLWRFRIYPLLEEYYFDDPNKLQDFTGLLEEVLA